MKGLHNIFAGDLTMPTWIGYVGAANYDDYTGIELSKDAVREAGGIGGLVELLKAGQDSPAAAKAAAKAEAATVVAATVKVAMEAEAVVAA